MAVVKLTLINGATFTLELEGIENLKADEIRAVMDGLTRSAGTDFLPVENALIRMDAIIAIEPVGEPWVA